MFPVERPWSSLAITTVSGDAGAAFARRMVSGSACARLESAPPNRSTVAVMPAPATARSNLPLVIHPTFAGRIHSVHRTESLAAANESRLNEGSCESEGGQMRAAVLVNRRTLMIAAFAVAAAVIALAAISTQKAGPSSARAADHLDAPGLAPPGGSVQSDITDLYAFQSPTNAANTVLVLNVNGVIGGNLTFGRGIPGVGNTRGVLYNFNIDNNGDAVTDVNLRVRFGAPADDGSQGFEVRRNGKLLISMDDGRSTAFGATPNIVTVGDVKAFAGRRDDPFFFDLAAFIGHDLSDPTKTRSFFSSAPTAIATTGFPPCSRRSSSRRSRPPRSPACCRTRGSSGA